MFRIESIKLTLEQLANDNKVLLLSVRPFKLYVNGQATDTIGGYSYECVTPKSGYEKLVVKVPDLPAIIDNDAITEGKKISFNSFTAKFYRDRNGYYQLSCKASKALLWELDEEEIEL